MIQGTVSATLEPTVPLVVFDIHGAAHTLDATDPQPLVGMALMLGYRLEMEVTPGGSVTLTAVP